MLKYMDEGKSTLEREIDKILKTGDISVNTLEKLHTMTDTYKNMLKICLLSEESGESYDTGSSYRRGRGRNAKRDSMGRYSNEEGYSADGNSYRDDDVAYARGGRMSYDSGKDAMMTKIGEMMEDASPKEREALKECMRAIERA